MNVRRFTAPAIGDALVMVRRKLGEDAIILRTRKVRRGGLLSFLSREMVEVTAASPDTRFPPRSPVEDRVASLRRGLEAVPAAGIVRDLRDELNELKGHVRDLSEQVKFERMPSLPSHLAERYKNMVRAGVDEHIAKELTQELNLRFKGEQLEDGDLVDKELIEMLSLRMPVRRPPRNSGKRARIVALIGPTGVGKTTTLAKLVTSYRYWGRSDTALVSADTYRVAAIEQLKTFASIAGLPIETVYQPLAMKNVLARHNGRDAVFIDTAGRSQADAGKLDELAAFLEAAQPDELLLCLAVSTRLEDQLDIVQRYRRLKPTGIIFTKLDESLGPGLMVSVVDKTSLPLTYLTCGQNVPDDILTANPRELAGLILKPDGLAELQRTHFEAWISAESKPERREEAVG